METIKITDLLKEVLTSWQVIFITIAILFYLNIVFYVSRRYHRPRMKLTTKGSFGFKKTKKGNMDIQETALNDNSSNELGLEEA